MIKIENVEVYGWEAAIRGMRNPMNSWSKSDSIKTSDSFYVCDNDLNLMKKLCNAGTDHRKFMRMITVWCDILAPMYWWKQFDTYKVGTVANSCSTMHKIQSKEFLLVDFSYEHLINDDDLANYGTERITPLDNLMITVSSLNGARDKYLETKDKRYWWQMIQLLPSSYNQNRTVTLNYEVLSNIYKSRRNHKLDEWHIFCHWIETLPYSELITGKE